MPTATEAEVITQWKAAVDILETLRVAADGLATAAGKYEVLQNALTGEYTPAGLAAAVEAHRATLSDAVSPEMIRAFLDPIVFEWGKVIDTAGTIFGGGYVQPQTILEALYDYLQAGSKTVETRGIAFGTITAGGSNTGNGVLRRLTVDENNHELEACTVEKKFFRCVQDANSGAKEEAEVFEVIGSQPSRDWLQQFETGTGTSISQFINNRHAGAGSGATGSLLSNGSFSDYSATTADERFSGWAQTYGVNGDDDDVTQDTTNYYRAYPGDTTPASLRIDMNSASDTVTLKQTLDDMNVASLRSDRPYFFRVMVNNSIGSGAGGNVIIRLGSQTVTTSVAGLSSGWNELFVPLDQNCWFANFNEDTFDVEIEWDAGTGGYVLFDDAILCELDLIDGSYWVLTQNNQNPTRWLFDDEITVTDALDGSAGDGKLQYYMAKAYGRYLPHAGSPTITDP